MAVLSNALQAIPEINGLILAGGFSSRMGMDKSVIDYHGLPQYQFLHQILNPFVHQVFISCRKEQIFDTQIKKIEDAYVDIGPMSGLLSAFLHDPTCAWLVVACDLPFIDKHHIQHLITNRDPHREATYYIDAETSFPEPLLTIFEPSILHLLIEQFEQEEYSLNRILQKCNGHALMPPDQKILRSVNTRDEMDQIKNKLDH